MATLLEEANNKLAVLQAMLDKSHYQLELDNLRIDNAKQADLIDRIRRELADLRKQLERDQQTKEVSALQYAIQEALVAMTELAPLNRLTEGGQMMCPLTLRAMTGYGTRLSNGFIYDTETIADVAKDKTYFPRKMPHLSFKDISIEISQFDVQRAQDTQKYNNLRVGLYAGMVLGMFLTILPFFFGLMAGINLAVLLDTALLGLGLGAGVVTGIGMAIFLAPVIIAMILGGVIGAWIYIRNHPSQLEPATATDGLASTARSLAQMDVTELDVDKQQKAELVSEPAPRDTEDNYDSAAGVGLLDDVSVEEDIEKSDELLEDVKDDAGLRPV